MDQSAHHRCADAVERLYHFLDGELDGASMADVQRHLDECLPCLEAFDFEAELRLVIARKCRDQVPEMVRVRIWKAIQNDGGLENVDGGMLPS
ncbi:MAG TPA: mycothiol system anti-sigma-R factor [Acidimicrobiales bacterium]|nr:mycothiol system anti-sigma-R factor [Acidimicrobiales bacterium]